ncbi:MAG TPA: putative sulfate exporter family transporter [Nocardioidaceae bacterium]|nr:putative sulfate exporter family transporter [Nocardioidaceae bacterium]
MPPTTEDPTTARPRPASRWELLPGLVLAGAGALVAVALHQLVDQIGTLTWSVLLGATVANLGLLPAGAAAGLRFSVRRLLRVGVVLLGFSLSLRAIAALGVPVIALVVGTLLLTLVTTSWLGHRLGLSGPRSLLIAVGFSICGASAVVAVQDSSDADEDDVAVAIGMVTICGTIAMLALPFLQAPLGLSDEQLGIWAGASIHEVGQVVGAAGPAGAAAVALAVVVKLTRVLMLAPVAAGISLWHRRNSAAHPSSRRPPAVPLFVAGFFGCVVLRSLGLVPAAALGPIGALQTLLLAAALFGLGTGAHLRSLTRGGGTALALATVSTLFISALTLLWVVLVVNR